MSAPAAARGRAADERGQVTVLVVGFFLVVATLVAVVVDASAAYLQRQRLANLADGAALAAADAVDLDTLYAQGVGESLPLSDAAAQQQVGAYLARAATDVEGLDWTVSATGDEVTVQVSGMLDLPLGVPGVADSVRVTATGAAQASLG
ncbi:hypothetical protein KLP28_09885 [Nocardioidaceae bacterium]|nr:hypothetical protein KLP28_09885 [Nocardioidaceae bacterium]